MSNYRSKNLKRILQISGQDHLQPTSRSLELRQHGHHHHEKAMEMDWTCDEKRARQHVTHSPSLDTRGEAETKATVERELNTLRA